MTRRAAAALALLLAISACQPVPSTPPSPGPPSATPGAAASASPIATTGAGAALGEALRDAISVDDILADLQRLEADAARTDGTRTAGGAGEKSAIEFVADELGARGWGVELQPVSLPYFHQVRPSVLEIDGAEPFDDIAEFKAMLLSGSGDVSGPLHALGFDATAQPGDRNGLGCTASDWSELPAGAIVLLQPGQCFRRDVIINAQDAGAAAVVTAYPEWHRDEVRRPTLISPGIRVPALATTHEVGLILAEAAQAGRSARVLVDAPVEMRTSTNVIAESPWGDPEQVLMVGGHIDSAVDGPGINDNGSGTMTILEIARRLDALADGGAIGGDAWRVRFAFFTGEEIGLLGSGAYTRALDPAGTAAIQAYLNFDMLGSGNGVREIYDGSATTRPTQSLAITRLFEEAFAKAGLASSTVALGGSGDHAQFDAIALPTGGIFSGASELKTEEQAALFGGQAGAPNDPCYHLACDTFERLDPELLEEMARAAAAVVGQLASGEVSLGGS